MQGNVKTMRQRRNAWTAETPNLEDAGRRTIPRLCDGPMRRTRMRIKPNVRRQAMDDATRTCGTNANRPMSDGIYAPETVRHNRCGLTPNPLHPNSNGRHQTPLRPNTSTKPCADKRRWKPPANAKTVAPQRGWRVRRGPIFQRTAPDVRVFTRSTRFRPPLRGNGFGRPPGHAKTVGAQRRYRATSSHGKCGGTSE
jgi:hypothetical protein